MGGARVEDFNVALTVLFPFMGSKRLLGVCLSIASDSVGYRGGYLASCSCEYLGLGIAMDTQGVDMGSNDRELGPLGEDLAYVVERYRVMLDSIPRRVRIVGLLEAGSPVADSDSFIEQLLTSIIARIAPVARDGDFTRASSARLTMCSLVACCHLYGLVRLKN